MRKLFTWLLVSAGIAALVRRLRRSAASPALDEDPADELRRKLAESRAEADDEPAPAPEASVEERRASVHDDARAALDEMKANEEQ